MYPFKIEGEADRHDIYVFRPTSLKGYPKDALQIGQIVEVSLRE